MIHPHRLIRKLTWPVMICTLVACQPSPTSKSTGPAPFVFRSLDLAQKHKNGERNWDLKSPLASYNLSRRLIRARQPSGLLYRSDKPSFAISASHATVINDGELLLLEGDVKLQQLTGQKVLITGNRLHWNPKLSLMVIDEKPQAFDTTSRLQSHRVEFDQKNREISFTGPTQLDRWSDQRNMEKAASTIIHAGNGHWNIDDGDLEAQGPILAEYRAKANETGQHLSAKKLNGNLIEGYIDLLKPVRVEIQDQQGELQASTTRWFFNTERLKSKDPFVGTMKTSSLRGDGFEVNLAETTVVIPRDCSFKQPGESLVARRCFWNWSSNEIEANGDVILKRKANQHLTRSTKMKGRLGKEGRIEFSAPGAKVHSEVKIKEPAKEVPIGRSRSQVSF